MLTNKNWLQTIITLILLSAVTTLIFLYTSGYRLEQNNKNTIDLAKTGMISAKSIPEGAAVYLNDKPITATNDTISGVKPGIHKLSISKKGFEQWSKDVEVFEELVTDITAVLVSQSPMFEPLTNTGASQPSVSPSFSKLAYFSSDIEKPGVWMIPINQGGLNIFRVSPSVILEDTKVNKYSDGISIRWSPDEKQLLIQNKDNIYYLVNLDTNTSQTVTKYEDILKGWELRLQQKRLDFVSKLDIPDYIKTLALSKEVIWSPDGKKFLYTQQNNDKLTYKVYNMEKPLPVGEKVNNDVFETYANEPQPAITWYADSFHLILTEGNIEQEKKGKISLVRIDGTNKVEIYGKSLHSRNVYSVPSGDKIIILTSFKSDDKTDLYTIGIR